jgi:septin family protein
MNEIRIYDFPERELGAENNWMRSLLPFAVVGSNTTLIGKDGTKYRGREYPWGTVNIEDQVRRLDSPITSRFCSSVIVTFLHCGICC